MIGPAVLAALAGMSAWFSLGTVAVIDDRAMARVAALPPLWWLPAIVVVAVAAAVVSRLSMARAWPLSISLLVLLPYLPFPVPPAFLIWSGSVEGLVWMAVVAGLLWPTPFPTAVGHHFSGAWTDPRRAPWLAALVLAACAAVGFVRLEGVVPAGDEPHYLVMTQSLLTDHDLRIENNHKRGDYRPYFKGDLAKADYIVRGQDGQIYPIHPPGISATVLPGFAVAGYRGAAATVIAGTAIASALAWDTAWLVSASIGGAWFAWAAVFLTTPYFFHTFTIYPDGVGGLLVMIGVWLLARLEFGRPVSRRMLCGCGTAIALLPWFHTRFAILATALGVVIVARLLSNTDRITRAAAFVSVPVVSAAAWFSYFWIIWGTPNPAAPYGTETNTSFANIGRGLTGLLIDQQFGVIANAPVYALAVAGLVWMARRRRRFAGELVIIAVPYMLAASAFHMWWGGVSAPARFIAALMPVAAIPIAWWWSRQSTASRAVGLVLLLLSIAMVVPVVAVDGNMVYNDRDGFDLLLEWVNRSVDLPMAFPSVHRGTTELALATAGVWVFGGLLLMAVSFRLKPEATPQGAAWTSTVWATAIIVMLAASSVWAINGVPGVTASRSQVSLITTWQPAWQTTMVKLRPFRRLAASEFVTQVDVESTDRAGRAASDPTMLKASLLPAGDYDIVTKGSGQLSGELFVWIGRTDQPSDRWRLEGHQPGYSGLTLHLPVPASSAVVRGDPEAKASVAEVTLRPKSLRSSAEPSGRYARTGIRYGSARAFFMDDRAYMEGGGFWTRGLATTTVVIDADANVTPTLWLQSGPVATTADLSIGSWTAHVALTPQSRQSVALPALAGSDSWVLTIRSGDLFRPMDHAPGNQDARPLGVWVELR